MESGASSDSASGKSNGARLVSATIAMAKITNAIRPSGKNLKTNQVCLRLLRLHNSDHAQRAVAVPCSRLVISTAETTASPMAIS